MALASYSARQGQQRSLREDAQVLNWAFTCSPGERSFACALLAFLGFRLVLSHGIGKLVFMVIYHHLVHEELFSGAPMVRSSRGMAQGAVRAGRPAAGMA